MANIPPVYKSQSLSNMAQQHTPAGAGSAGERGGKRQAAPQQEKKKKLVLTPLENSGTIYCPDGRPTAKLRDDKTDSRV
jgi:hypothetical protein